MYQCTQCLGTFNSDEVEKINCNGEIESFTEEEFEVNLQNPDWCVAIICEECRNDLEQDTEI